MAVEVKIEGLPQLREKLQLLIKQIDNDKVEPVLLDAARVIEFEAKSRAPSGPTGNLKRGIISKQLEPRGGRPRSALAGIDFRIAPHAHLVEYGTSVRVVKTKRVLANVKTGEIFGKEVAPMPRHPFFRPAWDANKKRVLNEIVNKFKNLIEQVAK